MVVQALVPFLQRKYYQLSKQNWLVFYFFKSLTFGSMVTRAALSCFAMISSSLRSKSISFTGCGDILKLIKSNVYFVPSCFHPHIIQTGQCFDWPNCSVWEVWNRELLSVTMTVFCMWIKLLSCVATQNAQLSLIWVLIIYLRSDLCINYAIGTLVH